MSKNLIHQIASEELSHVTGGARRTARSSASGTLGGTDQLAIVMQTITKSIQDFKLQQQQQQNNPMMMLLPLLMMKGRH